MTAETSKVTVHMVASLDGFIEKKNGDVSWLEVSDSYENGISEDAAEKISNHELSAIDCYVIGSKTYETALKLGWPYGDVPVYVLTHRELPRERQSIRFYQGDIKKLVCDKLRSQFENIWLVGGSEVTRAFIRSRLVDNIRMTIAPIIIGEGTPFFDLIDMEQALHLKNVTAFRNGFVELWYEIR